MSTAKFINEIIWIRVSAGTFQFKVYQFYPIFHRSWNFWEMFSLISFLKNFSRMKRRWREKLQLPVAIKRSFFSSYTVNEKNCSSDIGGFDSIRRKFFVKAISRFKSFSLNEYDLRILSSVFMMEMFYLRGKELKYAKELLLNYYGKSVQNSMRWQDIWVELKL